VRPVRSRKNQYIGINAHLHSLLQANSKWISFHTRHITHLADALTDQLEPMGYVVDVEVSLQVRQAADFLLRPRADVLIYDPLPTRSPPSSEMRSARGEWIPLPELFAERDYSEKPYRAITISSEDSGEPVVWIELLSPSNKGDSADAESYRAKRMSLLVGGLVFVEIDYLHETPPTFEGIHTYHPLPGRPSFPDAHPYQIVIADPRPKLEKGRAQKPGFDVDESIPTLDIPLNAEDVLTFDFDAPYQETFEKTRFGKKIDYAELPLNFFL
jgi:hypothetical protein